MSAIIYIFIFLLTFICILMRRRFLYWKKRNVPFIEPVFLFGNYKDFILQKRYLPDIAQDILKNFPDAPYVGTFFGTEPALIVKDPELIKIITTKDFYYFSGREVSAYTHNEVITQSLFFIHGDMWKVIRQNFTPFFSSRKLKNMFYLIKKRGLELEALIDRESRKCPNIEIIDVMARFAIDSISSCAFGVDSNAMGPDSAMNPFRNISRDILEVSTIWAAKAVSRIIWPRIFYGLRMKLFHQRVNDFFHKLLTAVFQSREYKPTPRNDFVDLVLDLKNKSNNIITGDSLRNKITGEDKKVHLEFNDELLIAQCVVFFTGGFETSSYTLSYTLYELAKNKEVQERAIANVDEYLKQHSNNLEYDCITGVPYLNACVDETLRLYPVIGLLTREVIDEYTLPTGLRLEKGVRIHIPVQYLHYHPSLYPDPEEYRPERFIGEERSNVKSYTYMPFGEGQRICIGKRFAKLQMMAALITILKKYRVELAADMPRTVRFEPRAFLPQAVGGIRLKFVQRNQHL